MQHRGRPEGNGKSGRKVLNILLTFLLFFLILVLIGMGYTLAMLGKMNYVGYAEATVSPEELEKYLEQNTQAAQSGEEEEEIHPGDMSVLIVDDDPIACEHAALVLEKAGIAAAIASSPRAFPSTI